MTKISKEKMFILCEIMRLDIDKWLEGCNRDEDPGEEFIREWISQNAAKYREAWESSKCSTCASWESCGWRALISCSYYKEE